ncbi:MAG TPA: hypothetical protein VJM14_03430 [Burkholderiales bacterium]|nr:hypothetical protein [Burkholderiales bacterium]
MTSDEIISRYGLLHIHAPMPEEIERAMSEERRLRALAFCDTARAAATWLARVFQPAHAGSAPSPAHTA